MFFKSYFISLYAWLNALILLFGGCAPVDVKGLIASGQLNQAQIGCDRLTGPERRDCFGQLSQAHIDARDFESAVRCYLKANEQTVFMEDFKDNRNGWSETDNADIFKKVRNGRLVFAHKREKNSWFAWPKTSIGVDENQDFRIEAVMTKMEGVDDHRYEVVWGLKDVDNHYAFGISGNGSYRYSKTKDGKWEGLTEWTSSDHIHKFNATNTLAVQKYGDLIRFFINGQQVLEKPYESGFGSKMGICLNRKMKVALSRFAVTRAPTEKKAFGKLLEGRLAKGDFIGFINHCAKAGYTKNEAYVRIAEDRMAAGDYEAAAINLERAGWSVRDLKKRVIFDEQFNDNRNKWFERDDTEIFYKVQGGQYHFDHRRDKGGWFSWPQTLVNIDESGDFRIESTMTKTSGVDSSAYEIFWGMKDNKNCYCFGVSGNGGYLYGKYRQGRWKTLLGWTKSAHINQGNLTNTLAVEKSGERIRFYVNNHFIAETSYEKQFGRKIGFSLNDKMAVEIDNLRVEQYAPKVAHALALKYAPKSAPAAREKEERKDLRRDTAPVETSTKR